MNETTGVLRISLNMVGSLLENAGFKRSVPESIYEKPKYVLGKSEVVVCVGCGWIMYNKVRYRAYDVNQRLLTQIIDNANS